MSATAHIDVANDSGIDPYPGWQPEHTSDFAAFLMQKLSMPQGCELSVAFIAPEPMAALHLQWLDLEGPTDVMSFPMDELREGATDPGHLGDVVICPQVAAEQAVTAGHDTRAEVELLLAHGVLHLLGHDHAEDEERAAMFGKQDALLAAWATHQGSAEHATDGAHDFGRADA